MTCTRSDSGEHSSIRTGRQLRCLFCYESLAEPEHMPLRESIARDWPRVAAIVIGVDLLFVAAMMIR